MGVWGTAVSSNDTYADVYGDFIDLYNKGLEVKDVSAQLILRYQSTINDNDDCNNFWFALAKAQWECKQLDPELLTKIIDIVKTGADLESWRRLDADPKSIAQRKIVLDKFLATLQTERVKAKSRKKKVIRQPVFEKGDCLTFKLANGNYGGAVVLEANKNTEYGHNLIALTRINQSEIPTIKDFEKAEVLIANFASWDNKVAISWYLPIRHKNVAHQIQKVNALAICKKFELGKHEYGFIADFDIHIIQQANMQFQSEQTKPRPDSRVFVKEFIRKKLWPFQ